MTQVFAFHSFVTNFIVNLCIILCAPALPEVGKAVRPREEVSDGKNI